MFIKTPSAAMLMQYLKLALLAVAATTALSHSTRQLADFDWDIHPKNGFPIIVFNDATQESEVVFKYKYAGTLTAEKVLQVNLYQSDCALPSDESLAFVEAVSGDELDVNIYIIQETIYNSVHYKDINATAAIIGFCLRVDYGFIDIDGNTDSVNFYETKNVTISVDLTENFTLTQIDFDRTSADNEAVNAQLYYPVEAYICSDDDSEVENPEPLIRGSSLRVCINIDDTVVTENIIVEDILTFVISQPNGTATDSVPINNAVTNALTGKVCRESGICNVRTQLQSKFFTDPNPGNLRVDGVAILAFGKASPNTEGNNAVRRLRAPIRGLITDDDVKAFMAAQQQRQQDSNEAGQSETARVSVVAGSSQRMLHDGAAQSEFVLEVGVQGIDGDSMIVVAGGGGGSMIVVAVVTFVVMLVVCGLGFLFCASRSRNEEEEETVKHDGSTASREPIQGHVPCPLHFLASTATAVEGISESTRTLPYAYDVREISTSTSSLPSEYTVEGISTSTRSLPCMYTE
jgi:hypothetical protein